MLKIVIDTKGADKGVDTIVKGVSMALEKFPEASYLLVGDEEYIKTACEQLSLSMERIEILDAPEEITNYDNPAEAIFTKRNSSMIKSLEELSKREDLFGFLTAGNTGALLVGAMRYLPRETRVRPALAALLPTQSGGFTCVVDTGATVDCTPQMLHHFAHLGREFMMSVYGIENPKIGLLSNGAEESKGNKLVKETFPLLREDKNLNFIGNVEGTNALSGICDVLVCDGFAGNQVLKITEGTAKRIITDVVKYARKTQSEDVNALIKQLLAIYDIESLGGANLLGVRKPVIKMHGSMSERTVVNSTEMLLNMAQNKAVFEENKYVIQDQKGEASEE